MFKSFKDLPNENKELLNNSKVFDAYLKSDLRSLKIESYFNVYDEIFEKYLGKEIIFVEIGILHGGSLKMWREYFGKKARIIGIDINPEAKNMEKEGFEIFIGSQSSESFWDTFFHQVGEIDILFDDGGHQNAQQIITVNKSLPFIKDGGIIVTEDVHTSYLRRFGNPSRFSFINYAKNKIDKINYRFPEIKKNNIEKKIYSINFYESIVVFNINSKKSIIPNYIANNPNSHTKKFFADGSFTEFFPNIHRFIDKKLHFLTKVPVIKKIIRILFYKKNFFAKMKEYFILNKFFD